ncbi:hypothetical protein BV898_11985 [Hypsibius exemplaris]|uniref:G-protein coupled receptors family 1 profile domain-containing protein n=1 Tax=Hypsibius exemplaris TaxID=2072580 RepID=A0A1W0WEY2_HYPEX|nr:hypothetical protein BV898_11985 [Hypsibius exemplaris]
MSNASGNATAVTFANNTLQRAVPTWTTIGILNTANVFASLFGNTFLLVLLLSSRELRTPFNIHIIDLAAANLLASTASFLYSWSTLFGTVWTYGEFACTYYQYIYWVECSVAYYQHLLIALIRLWSVTHPHSYRVRHTKRLALGLIIGIWAGTHAFMLPFVIRDGLYFRRTLRENNYRCRANEHAQWTYNVVAQVVMYLLPIALQIMVFPALFVKQKRKLRNRSVLPSSQGNRISNIPLNAPVSLPGTSGALPLDSSNRLSPSGAGKVARIKRPTSGIVFLAIWSLCALVSWLPINLGVFMTTLNPAVPVPVRAWQVFGALVVIRTTIDPIIFLLSVRNLREAVHRLGNRIAGHFRP